VDHAVDAQAQIVRLLQQLERGIDIAERTDRVGAAARDVIRLATALAHRLPELGAGGVHVGVRRDEAELGAKQPVEQHVAGGLVCGAVPGNAPLEQRRAVQPIVARCGCGLAHVVGLHGAVGDHAVRLLGQRGGDQELELPGLVAAGRKSGAVSRLTYSCGPPSSLVRFGIGSSGVGRCAKRTRAKRARCMAKPLSSVAS
jgi:hypothetical protein